MNLIKELRDQHPHGHHQFINMALEEMRLHSAKNRDYTKGGDPLGNFVRVATICSLYNLDLSSPVTISFIYMLKQLDAALWMLSQGYEGQTEGFDARLRDVGVYAKIIRILWGRFGCSSI